MAADIVLGTFQPFTSEATPAEESDSEYSNRVPFSLGEIRGLSSLHSDSVVPDLNGAPTKYQPFADGRSRSCVMLPPSVALAGIGPMLPVPNELERKEKTRNIHANHLTVHDMKL
jgi:hypothetical protein